jgi:nucleoside diphosphate kinase
MPIPNTPITPSQFDYLERNISAQADQFTVISAIAQSGLQYVVDTNVIAPEVDLVNAFYAHYVGMESFNSVTNFVQVASQLNLHVINRGTVFQPTDTLSTRLNRYLSDNGLTVTRTYATISSGGGFFIDDPANIDP